MDFKRALETLAPGTSLPTNWDALLPKYAAVDLDEHTVAVFAQGGKAYVVSLVTSERVDSVVLSPSEPFEAKLRALKKAHMSRPALEKSVAEPVRDSSRDVLKDPLRDSRDTLRDLRDPLRDPSGPLRDPRNPLRDPNAPPGFEYETYPSRQPIPGPHLQFDPDQDLYPPGGQYPTLGPMQRGPFRPSSGGMHPTLGANQPPHIRYDPTSPFDPNSSFNPSGSFP